jgi:asparagine synthase (glutamine-hydrolysing)
MCGIFAASGPRGTLPDDDTCMRALGLMADRGPDGAGLHRETVGEREIVVGHRRLAIVGVADGVQPLVSRRAVAAVNGEFYGHLPVRAELEASGARFATSSDSEILPHLYDAHSHGLDSPSSWLAPLSGEWTFALADRTDAALWTACDPWGTKPLRWWRSPDGQTSMMASTASVLFALGVPCHLDEEALRFAMGFQYLPYGRTLFRDVGMLPPGAWMRMDAKGVQQGRTWDHLRQRSLLQQNEVPSAEMPGSRDGWASLVRSTVEHAVLQRIPAERGFCTHLSGGIDSAIITALAMRATGRVVDGYCASFPWAGEGDETAAATITARHLGARLHPVEMTPSALMDAMDEAPLRAEGLSINLHAGAKILVADAVSRDGCKVAMTGEGADEAFLGYEHFRYDFPEDQRPWHGDVNPASVGIMRPSGGKLPAGFTELEKVLGSMPSWMATKAAAGGPLAMALGPRLASLPFTPSAIADCLPAGWTMPHNTGLTALALSRAMWSTYCMSGYILRGLDDAMGMARGVESRLAFLDPAVQSLAALVPARMHYGADGIEKGLLREAMSDLLPAEVLARPKRAFLAPGVLALPEGIAWARSRILDGRALRSGLICAAGAEALLCRPRTPVRDAAVMTLVSLSGFMEGFALS